MPCERDLPMPCDCKLQCAAYAAATYGAHLDGECLDTATLPADEVSPSARTQQLANATRQASSLQLGVLQYKGSLGVSMVTAL
jgi:hypothetical protein